jgi:hypothetical protein
MHMARLTEIAPNLYAAHDRLKTGVQFPLRMVVVDTGEGLWLHSPIEPTPELVDEVRALGEVRWLVSGSRFHHLFLAPWQERCPGAEVWRVDDLRARTPPWTSIEQLPIEGAPRVDEVVFLHPSTKTLIVTDLFFNIRETESGFTKLVLRMAGAFGKPAQSKLYRFWTKDRPALRGSLERVLAWDFERVLMAHGAPVERDGRAVLEDACGWVLERRRAA